MTVATRHPAYGKIAGSPLTAVLFPLALGRLERWRIEDMPGG